MVDDLKNLSLEELFEEYKKLPDWDRFPLPEVFYEHFKVKKPQPASLNECIMYSPPPYQSLNERGKVELRGVAEGGVRTIDNYFELPVEVKRTNEETGELEEYPLVKPMTEEERNMERVKEAMRMLAYMKLDSGQNLSNPPTERNNSESQPA
jgi:hypothetical protein